MSAGLWGRSPCHRGLTSVAGERIHGTSVSSVPRMKPVMAGHPGFPVDCVHPLRPAAHPDAIPRLEICPCPPPPTFGLGRTAGALGVRRRRPPPPSPHRIDRPQQGRQGVPAHLEVADIGAARSATARISANPGRNFIAGIVSGPGIPAA